MTLCVANWRIDLQHYTFGGVKVVKNLKTFEEAEKEVRKRFNLGSDFLVLRVNTKNNFYGDFSVEITFRHIDGTIVSVSVSLLKREPKEGEFWQQGNKVGIIRGDQICFGDGTHKAIDDSVLHFVSDPRKDGEFKRGDVVELWGIRCTISGEETRYLHSDGGGELAIVVYKGEYHKDSFFVSGDYALAKPHTLKLLIPVELR